MRKLDIGSKEVVLFAAFVVSSAVNFGAGVALSWLLPQSDYGRFGAAQSTLLLCGLATGGSFQWVVARDVAMSGPTPYGFRAARCARDLNTALGVLLSLLIANAWAIGVLPLDGWSIGTIAFTVIALASRAADIGEAIGTARFGALAVNQIGETVIRGTCGLAAVAAGLGVFGALVGYAVGALFSAVHLARIAKWRRGRAAEPAEQRAPGRLELETMRQALSFFVASLGIGALTNFDMLGLSAFANPVDRAAALGVYQVAATLARLPILAAQALSAAIFADSANGAKTKSTREALRPALRTWLIVLLPIEGALALMPGPFLSLIFPYSFGSAAATLTIAAIGGAILSLAVVCSTALQAHGRKGIPAVATTAAAGAQLAYMILAVPSLRERGAAASLGVAGAVALTGMLAGCLVIPTRNRHDRVHREVQPWNEEPLHATP